MIIGTLFATAALCYSLGMKEQVPKWIQWWHELPPKEKRKEDKESYSKKNSRSDFSQIANSNSHSRKKYSDSGYKNPHPTGSSSKQPKWTDFIVYSEIANKKEKDESIKKKNESLNQILMACSFDKDGNELPVADRRKKLQSLMTEDQYIAFEKEIKDNIDIQENDDLKNNMSDLCSTISQEEYDEILENGKKDIDKTIARLELDKRLLEAHTQKLKDIQTEIDAEKDDEKKGELIKKQTELQQNPPKSLVNFAIYKPISGLDNLKHHQVQKDEHGNIIKDEEIKDPNTGKKMKVKTYTGPRGGKFYYPEGKPKTPENKVYIARESVLLSLKNYLLESIK